MRNFMVFIWESYEAGGGMHDFKGDFKSYLEAIQFLNKKITSKTHNGLPELCAHIYSLSDKKIVFNHVYNEQK